MDSLINFFLGQINSILVGLNTSEIKIVQQKSSQQTMHFIVVPQFCVNWLFWKNLFSSS